MIGNFLGHGSTVTQQTVLPLRNAFADEVFQRNYSVEELRKKLVRRLRETREVNAKMDKLNKMVVE